MSEELLNELKAVLKEEEPAEEGSQEQEENKGEGNKMEGEKEGSKDDLPKDSKGDSITEEEKARREEQSFKDKYYATNEKLEDLSKEFEELKAKLDSKKEETNGLTEEQLNAINTIKEAGLEQEFNAIDKQYTEYAASYGEEAAKEKFSSKADELLKRAESIVKQNKLDQRISAFENKEKAEQLKQQFDKNINSMVEDPRLKKATLLVLEKEWDISPDKIDSISDPDSYKKFVKAAKIEAAELLKKIEEPEEKPDLNLSRGRKAKEDLRESAGKRLSFQEAQRQMMKQLGGLPD